MDTWTKNYDSANALAAEIDSDLKNRTQKALQGADISQMTMTTRRKITKLENTCAQLEEDLNIQSRDPITYRVTEVEINRREGSLMSLQNRIETFKVKISQTPQQDLMGGGAKRVWGESADTEGLGNQDVLQLQKKKMEEQDKRLGQISKQVGVIHKVSTDIHDELDEHHKLLDHIDGKIDNASVKVSKETKRMDVLRKEAGTGTCWICICILMLVIIILAFV